MQFFGGQAISKQNLSEWRHGGYEDWLRQQERDLRIDRVAEEGATLKRGEDDAALLDGLSRIAVSELMVDMDALDKLEGEERWKRLRGLCQELARLQNRQNHNERMGLARARFGHALTEDLDFALNVLWKRFEKNPEACRHYEKAMVAALGEEEYAERRSAECRVQSAESQGQGSTERPTSTNGGASGSGTDDAVKVGQSRSRGDGQNLGGEASPRSDHEADTTNGEEGEDRTANSERRTANEGVAPDHDEVRVGQSRSRGGDDQNLGAARKPVHLNRSARHRNIQQPTSNEG
jgi:hypothetical protein